MTRIPTRVLGSGLLAAATAMLGAALFVSLANGFGSGDLAPFVIWCALLGIFVAVLSVLILRLRLPERRFARHGAAALIGLVGGVLFTISVAVGLGPLIGGFSFPVLYLWTAGAVAGVMWAAWPAQPAERARSRVTPLVLVASLVLAVVILLPRAWLVGAVYVWDRAEHEVHLLPEGFRGPVVIIFDQPAGAPEERDGRARLYRVPPNGVLRTQLPFNDGWSAPDYFFLDRSGRRSPIVRGAPCEDSLPGDPVQACLMGRMWIGDREGPGYSAYVVTRQADRRDQYERGDSLVRAVVFGDSLAPAP